MLHIILEYEATQYRGGVPQRMTFCITVGFQHPGKPGGEDPLYSLSYDWSNKHGLR